MKEGSPTALPNIDWRESSDGDLSLSEPSSRQSMTCMAYFETLLNVETANSFLHVNLETAIEYQVKEWSTLVGAMVLDYIFLDLHLLDHVYVLKSVLLMQSGNFVNCLLERLEDMGETIHVGDLNLILREVVFTTLLELPFEYRERVSFIPMSELNMSMRQEYRISRHVFDMVHLSYKIDWPLNIIFTQSAMQKYHRIFAHLLLFRQASFSLRHAAAELSLQHDKAHHLALFQVRHFVHAMLGYLNDVAIHMSWVDFTEHARCKAMHLDEILYYHDNYLDRICFLSLLHKNAEPLLNAIYAILRTIAQFIEMTIDTNKALAIFRTFQLQVASFLRSLRTLIQRGYQPHLQDLLLRFDMSDYYDCSI